MSGRVPHGWETSPDRPALPESEVHVWLADAGAADAGGLAGLLDPAERERSGRFRFESDRRLFVVGRGLLRLLAGAYAGRPPERVRFEIADHGKPRLFESEGAGLAFNVSHSEDLVLLAFARDTDVGVDVEAIRPENAGVELAGRFFSERERRLLGATPPGDFSGSFFRCWTRKEAYVKARGEGLSHPLKSFSVPIAPATPAEKLVIESADGSPAGDWSLRDLGAPDGYVAALAVRGPDRRLVRWRWGAERGRGS